VAQGAVEAAEQGAQVAAYTRRKREQARKKMFSRLCAYSLPNSAPYPLTLFRAITVPDLSNPPHLTVRVNNKAQSRPEEEQAQIEEGGSYSCIVLAVPQVKVNRELTG